MGHYRHQTVQRSAGNFHMIVRRKLLCQQVGLVAADACAQFAQHFLRNSGHVRPEMNDSADAGSVPHQTRRFAKIKSRKQVIGE